MFSNVRLTESCGRESPCSPRLGMRELSKGPLALIKAIHHLSGTVTAHKRNQPVGRREVIRATEQWSRCPVHISLALLGSAQVQRPLI